MPLNRRALLLWLGRGTAAGLAALTAGFSWGFFAYGHGSGTRTRRYLGRRAEVLARVRASRDGVWLDVENSVVLMLDPQGGRDALAAVSLVCTHLGCTLRPTTGNRTLECPCHGSAFAFLEGELGRVLVGPATRDLDRFAVVTVGDRLFLEA